MSRIAVVTGGAGAIGAAIAGALAESGHEVAVIDRDGEFACDLALERDVERVAGAVLARLGRCDVLVHAAAAFDQFSLDELDLGAWRRVQAVNVESALLLCRAFTPGMAERRFGRVIVITSDTVWAPPSPRLLPYVASKATLEGVVRVLARSLGGDGITVNAVEPGLTRTPVTTAELAPEQFAAVVAAQALPRVLLPADVAGTVAFLASDQAATITGQTLCTDGGLLMR